MNKGDLEFDLQPFTDDIKLAVVMPDGSLREIIRCSHRYLATDAEATFLLYVDASPLPRCREIFSLNGFEVDCRLPAGHAGVHQ